MFNRNIGRCLGLAIHGDDLWITGDTQIFKLVNALENGQRGSDDSDALFVPKLSYFTGNLDCYDIAVPFALGTLTHITQIGGGTAKVQAAAGVSLNGVTGGSVDLAGQWSGAVLTKRGANAWVIQGALAGSVA